MAQDSNEVETLARARVRSLRRARGWSLDDLAARAHISASTISRLETGGRRLTLDTLVVLARALDTSVDALLADTEQEPVIRPVRNRGTHGWVQWPLNRPDDPSGRVVMKVRMPGSKKAPEQQVHPGRDWFFVLEGTARLVLGDREHLVRTGEAAEFETMTPHSITGYGGPVEMLMIFDRHGERAHT